MKEFSTQLCWSATTMALQRHSKLVLTTVKISAVLISNINDDTEELRPGLEDFENNSLASSASRALALSESSTSIACCLLACSTYHHKTIQPILFPKSPIESETSHSNSIPKVSNTSITMATPYERTSTPPLQLYPTNLATSSRARHQRQGQNPHPPALNV